MFVCDGVLIVQLCAALLEENDGGAAGEWRGKERERKREKNR